MSYEDGSRLKEPDDFLAGQPKPTIEQVAWVFAHLFDHLAEPGSFRYLIYTRMGFDHDAYTPLYLAGGQAISNAFFDLEELLVNRREREETPQGKA